MLFNQRIEAGFDFFFNEYYLLICIYANKIIIDRYVAEEIASDAFLSTWRSKSYFDSIDNLKSYLLVSAKHGALKYINKRKRNAGHLDTILWKMNLTTQSHEETLIAAECLSLLSRAIETLPPQCKLICKKMFIDGKKAPEIAKELGLAKTTVRTQKARGIVLIMENYKDK